jgi:hypothetical protein
MNYKTNLKNCQIKRKLEMQNEILKKEKELIALKNRLQSLNNAIKLQ